MEVGAGSGNVDLPYRYWEHRQWFHLFPSLLVWIWRVSMIALFGGQMTNEIISVHLCVWEGEVLYVLSPPLITSLIPWSSAWTATFFVIVDSAPCSIWGGNSWLTGRGELPTQHVLSHFLQDVSSIPGSLKEIPTQYGCHWKMRLCCLINWDTAYLSVNSSLNRATGFFLESDRARGREEGWMNSHCPPWSPSSPWFGLCKWEEQVAPERTS